LKVYIKTNILGYIARYGYNKRKVYYILPNIITKSTTTFTFKVTNTYYTSIFHIGKILLS